MKFNRITMAVILISIFALPMAVHADSSGSYREENYVAQEFLVASPNFAPSLGQVKIKVQIGAYAEGVPTRAQITASYALKSKDDAPTGGEIYFSESFLENGGVTFRLNGKEIAPRKLSVESGEAMESLFEQGRYTEYFKELATAVKSPGGGDKYLNAIAIESTGESVLEISYERELTHFVQRDKEGGIQDEFHEWNYVYSALATFSDFETIEVEILNPTEFYIVNMVSPEESRPGRAIYKVEKNKFDGELLMFQLMPNVKGKGSIFSVLITFAGLAAVFLGLRAMYTAYVRNRPYYARKNDE